MRHATYLINRIATRVLVSRTPYEAFKNKKPKLKVINRDIIFDKTRKWKWNSTETIETIRGGFSITFGDLGNKGVNRDDKAIEQEDKVNNTEEQSQTYLISVKKKKTWRTMVTTMRQ